MNKLWWALQLDFWRNPIGEIQHWFQLYERTPLGAADNHITLDEVRHRTRRKFHVYKALQWNLEKYDEFKLYMLK